MTKNDRSTITQVFDYNSIKFMGLIQEMNEDQFASDKVVYGGALNYHGVNIDAIVRRMESKMKQGCSFFLTQPIYSDEDGERIGQLREMTGAKILGGIMPLVSRKTDTAPIRTASKRSLVLRITFFIKSFLLSTTFSVILWEIFQIPLYEIYFNNPLYRSQPRFFL